MDEEAALDPLLGSPLSEAERATVKTTLDAADPSTFARLLCRDLRGADLRGVRFPKYIPLEGIDLSRVDLRGADLSDASWGCGYGVDCADAVLAGADLRGAELGPECDFTRADLTGANLSGLQLNGSPFTTPRFTGATLVRADLTNTSLVGAKFADVDLRGADLTGARLPPMSPWNRPKADLAFLVENFFPGARWDTSTRWPADLAACAEQLAERSEILPDGTRRVPPMPPRPARTVSMVSTGTMDLPDQQSPWGVW
ncbi:pentapeptide repeat-containing protein [Frankia sp. QA3]|uniref:pentapeptide repeat-containing protein n=1 Tax=Frankia sp. QA3 TaxID=710111 RepID=UPI001E2A7F6F|nr:pentapeptide repeat-containing protein [Frankia sp. QA3]